MLAIEDLHISFHRYNKGLDRTKLTPVHNLNLEIGVGEIMAIVGESGGGKSLLAHAVLDILPANAETGGKICFCGQELDRKKINKLRGRKISLVPQSVSYLNPLLTVGRQVFRAAVVAGLSKKEAKIARDSAFDMVSLEEASMKLYPFQLSGGMAQRVLVAMATVGGAPLIIADEPTTGLDPELLAGFLELLRVTIDNGRAAMLITHDLNAARKVADKIAVFAGGTIVEIINNRENLTSDKLSHPYSRALWDSLPENGFNLSEIKHTYSARENGNQQGCLFRGACCCDREQCEKSIPPLMPVKHGLVRCWNA